MSQCGQRRLKWVIRKRHAIRLYYLRIKVQVDFWRSVLAVVDLHHRVNDIDGFPFGFVIAALFRERDALLSNYLQGGSDVWICFEDFGFKKQITER